MKLPVYILKRHRSYVSEPSVFRLCDTERVSAMYSVRFTTSTPISLRVLHLLVGIRDSWQWLRGNIL